MYLIKSVDIRSCARIAAALYGGLALLVAPVGIVGVLISAIKADGAGIGISLLFVIAPLLYGGLGFLLGAIAAWVYNFAAKWVGGIEIDLAEATSQASHSTIQIGLK